MYLKARPATARIAERSGWSRRPRVHRDIQLLDRQPRTAAPRTTGFAHGGPPPDGGRHRQEAAYAGLPVDGPGVPSVDASQLVPGDLDCGARAAACAGPPGDGGGDNGSHERRSARRRDPVPRIVLPVLGPECHVCLVQDAGGVHHDRQRKPGVLAVELNRGRGDAIAGPGRSRDDPARPGSGHP